MKKYILLTPLLIATTAAAQPIYRCGNTYSHDPCINAKEVTTTYTEGMDSMSGKKRIDSNEAMTRAFRDMNANLLGKQKGGAGYQEEWNTKKRRTTIPYQAQTRCSALDTQIPKQTDPQKLYELRLEYRKLGC